MQHLASHYGNLIAEIAYQSLLSSRVRLPFKFSILQTTCLQAQNGASGTMARCCSWKLYIRSP